MSAQLNNHTFVICAYKESAYLEQCILSLKKQTVKSNIIMVTSTPNSFISELAEKYDIELYVNEGIGGIVQDWNFGYSKAKTSYVTIAHQDDVYFKSYAKEAMKKLENGKDPLIYFTNYFELRNQKYIKKNKLLKIKRIMLAPLKVSAFHSSKFVRRRILSFGCPICCPSVTFNKDLLPKQVFSVGFRSDEDWEAWEKLSRMKGQFIYNARPLMAHRIHEESETSIIIGDNARTEEDYQMLLKFWPKCLAKIVLKHYLKGQECNSLE